MNIAEIKEKNNSRKFIDVDEFKNPPLAKVNSLDKLLCLDDNIYLYEETTLNEEEATEETFETTRVNTLTLLLNDADFIMMGRRDIENILDDVVCDYEDKIRKKCKTTYGYFLTIRSLKYNIEFDYEEFDIDENREKNIAEWLFTLCKEYRQEAEKERLALIDKEEKEIKAIEDYIKEKKSIYNECTTQVGKKKIISNTVYEIKEKFNNSTVIKRFTKDRVEFLLDRKD